YEVIRLLRRASAEGPCVPFAYHEGPEEISLGKQTKCPATTGSTTPGSRLDVGRCLGGQAHPDPGSLTELRSRSVPRYVYGFHPTRPHGRSRDRDIPDPRRVPSSPTALDSPFSLVQLPSTHGWLQYLHGGLAPPTSFACQTHPPGRFQPLRGTRGV